MLLSRCIATDDANPEEKLSPIFVSLSLKVRLCLFRKIYIHALRNTTINFLKNLACQVLEYVLVSVYILYSIATL